MARVLWKYAITKSPATNLLQRFRDNSISHKLTLIIVVTSFIVLFLASMNIRQVLEISSNFSELPRVRRFDHEFCNTHAGERFDEGHLAQMVLAVNEATVHIMEHAYQCEDGYPIQGVVHADDAQVAIELLHSCEAFTPESVPPPLV